MKYTNSEVIHKKIGEIQILQYYALLEFDKEIEHCFTLKHGGYSKGNYANFNLGLNTNDSLQIVKKNYQLLCDNTQFCYYNIFRGEQVHSDNVIFVDQENKGVLENNIQIQCDGSITNISTIPLITNCADCMTILIYDTVNKYIASIHAGWQGVLNNIVVKGIQKMITRFNCNVNNMIVCISPHICTSCFEVMQDVKEKFEKEFFCSDLIYNKDKEHYNIDLEEILVRNLLTSGIKKKNIHSAHICNKCNIEDFYSYRENADTGRMAFGIMLK